MELGNIRERIDSIDKELTELFVTRMQTVADVAAAKRATGKAVKDHARERTVLYNVTGIAGETYAPYVENLYKMIFDLCCNYESAILGNESPIGDQIIQACRNCDGKPFPTHVHVACQGTEGAYQQQACERIFKYPDIQYFSNFNAVFDAVENGTCEYGVLPIENSTAGSVTQVYDLMEKHSFHIVAAYKLRIEHCLMRKSGATGPIRRIVSHEQALRQCSDFFDAHPEYTPVPMANTAMAAEYVSKTDDDDVAVIASKVCADIYGLDILSENISNTMINYTRFICISRKPEIFPGARKISITFNLPHEPGTLNNIIGRLAIAGVSITKLESRPIPGKEFEFRFFFDFEADPRDPKIVSLITELVGKTEHFVFLGAYNEG